ncbi:MAG: XAC2610-related protein [Bacteroidia bacterium]
MNFFLLLPFCTFFFSCSPHAGNKKQDSRIDSLNIKRIKDSTAAWRPAPVTCRHTDLSDEFDIEISATRYQTRELGDSTFVTVTAGDKEGNKKAIFGYYSTFFLDTVFEDCNFVRSYSTGKNKDAEVVDNDFGDVVIADLNFDGRDDLALKRELGGNGGPLYYFYIQDKKGDFAEDEYLSDSVVFFPNEINEKKKMITTLVHASAYSVRETKYSYRNNKWIVSGNRIIGFGK